LAHGSVDYGPEQGVVHFKRLSEMVLNMHRDYAGQQHSAELLMSAANVAITEPMDKITAA
jgi:hypothetical protein